MKKKITAAVISALMSMSLTGCGGDDPSATENAFVEGRFIQGTNSPMIVIDRTGPCTISTDDDAMFAEFTDGDLIKLEYDGTIAESYPGQISKVYGAELVEDGDITDIDQNTLDSLIEMGHYDSGDTQQEYTMATGIFIRTNEDKPAVLLGGTTPCELPNASEDMFSGLTEGDMVELQYDGMVTRSYPAQIPNLVSMELVEDGEISYIDQSVREELVNIGWLDSAE